MYYWGMENAAEEDWRVLASLFPEGWDRQAKETGAMARNRGINVPETLLRLFLLHVARGYSLRETSVRAEESGLARISDVGILKRLKRSEDWLHWLCTQLVLENGVRMPPPRRPGAVRIVDGTIIKENSDPAGLRSVESHACWPIKPLPPRCAGTPGRGSARSAGQMIAPMPLAEPGP